MSCGHSTLRVAPKRYILFYSRWSNSEVIIVETLSDKGLCLPLSHFKPGIQMKSLPSPFSPFNSMSSLFSRLNRLQFPPPFLSLIIFICFSIYPCAEHYFTWNLVWRLPAELPRIHATTPLLHKNLDGYGVHTSWFFSFQMFERLGVQIFVRLACFRANETPKRTNLSFISIL